MDLYPFGHCLESHVTASEIKLEDRGKQQRRGCSRLVQAYIVSGSDPGEIDRERKGKKRNLTGF